MKTPAYLLAASFVLTTVAHSATSDLTLTSSSQYLVDAFNWNKNKALRCVVTGITNNIPCYAAAYSDRDCFCIRDACHQCEGAALLGLNEENLSMWKTFASLQTEARGYFTAWEENFSGGIYLTYTTITMAVGQQKTASVPQNSKEK